MLLGVCSWKTNTAQSIVALQARQQASSDGAESPDGYSRERWHVPPTQATSTPASVLLQLQPREGLCCFNATWRSILLDASCGADTLTLHHSAEIAGVRVRTGAVFLYKTGHPHQAVRPAKARGQARGDPTDRLMKRRDARSSKRLCTGVHSTRTTRGVRKVSRTWSLQTTTKCGLGSGATRLSSGHPLISASTLPLPNSSAAATAAIATALPLPAAISLLQETPQDAKTNPPDA